MRVPDENGEPLIDELMKADCIGEFFFMVEQQCSTCSYEGPEESCEVCQGVGTYSEPVVVPWETCKEIYKAMAVSAARFDLASESLSSERALSSQWPEGLEAGVFYVAECDDKGRGAQLKVMVSPADSDVHVSMMELTKQDDDPWPFPSVRVRTYAGGGRAQRTRQALLWLAEAIRLDAADGCPTTEAVK